jgi:hypothetical protein
MVMWGPGWWRPFRLFGQQVSVLFLSPPNPNHKAPLTPKKKQYTAEPIWYVSPSQTCYAQHYSCFNFGAKGASGRALLRKVPELLWTMNPVWVETNVPPILVPTLNAESPYWALLTAGSFQSNASLVEHALPTKGGARLRAVFKSPFLNALTADETAVKLKTDMAFLTWLTCGFQGGPAARCNPAQGATAVPVNGTCPPAAKRAALDISTVAFPGPSGAYNFTWDHAKWCARLN